MSVWILKPHTHFHITILTAKFHFCQLFTRRLRLYRLSFNYHMDLKSWVSRWDTASKIEDWFAKSVRN